MCQNTLLEEPKYSNPLFHRRTDIDIKDRLKIGILLNYYPRWGLITDLANRYGVSRPFIYEQKNRVKEFLTILEEEYIKEKPSDWRANIKQLLLYRIRGGISISKCSDFVSSGNFLNSSLGWISQMITFLGNLVGENFSAWQGKAFWASDEIYLVNGLCVLVTCDPVSSVIFSIRLCDKLSCAAWQTAWANLQSQGVEPIGIVGDEGSSLLSAHSKLDSVDYQADTFHAITQRFGKVSARLERQALACIKEEYEREQVYLNAKSAEQRTKKGEAYEEKILNSETALSLLSDFKWLYGQISCQLKVVRTNGEVRTKQSAVGEVQAALELMEECLELDLSKEIKGVRKLLPDLFQYLDKAKEVYCCLEKKIQPHILPFHLAYWQYKKDLINLKKAADKHRLTKSKQWLIQIIEEYQKQYPQQFEIEKQMVFLAMQSVIQSSAMVECINSILRPIFNESKGQVSQQTLNLVRYWHNRRVYKRGLRKGKSPLELLTGNKTEQDWTKGIFELIEQNQLSKMAA